MACTPVTVTIPVRYASTIVEYGDCGSSTYYTATDQVRTSCSNPVSHRPLPNDLGLSVTSLPEQWRSTSEYGIKEKRYLSGMSYCGAPILANLRPTWITNRDYFAPLTSVYCTAEAPNWALDMRMQIKDLAVNLGTSLAEYRQTSNMFLKGARGIASAWQQYKKAKKLRFDVTPCSVAAGHLMYDFGVRPLMNDVYDSVQMLQQRLEKPVYRRFCVTKSTQKSASGASYSASDSLSYRAIVLAKIDPNTWSGFTLGNPAEIAWEVVPFSFVVDWMYPVGDYLSSLDALKGVSGMAGTLSIRKRYSVQSWSTAAGYTNIRPARYTKESYSRSLITSIPIPALPKYEPSKSLRNVAQGISLLTTLNKRCK